MKKIKLILPILGLSAIATTTPCIVACSNKFDPMYRAEAYAKISNACSHAISIQPEAETKILGAAEWLYDCLDEATVNEQCVALGVMGAGTGELWDEEERSGGIIWGIAKNPEAEEKLVTLMKLATDTIMDLKAPDKIYAIGVGTTNAFTAIARQPEAYERVLRSWSEMVDHILNK